MSMNLSKVFGKRGWSLLCGFGLAAGLLVSGCSSTPQQKTFADVPGVTSPASTPASAAATNAADVINPDLLFAGEPILVTFSDLPYTQPPIQDQIKTDGTITLLQNATFVAAGKTRRQLEDEVHNYYVPNIYKQMTVSIQVQQATRFYYVDGEVKQPARQVYIGPTTVLKAIASAGGLTDFSNRRNIKLIHSDGRIQTINYNKAISHPEQDLQVYPDDKVFVARRLLW